MKLTSLMCLLSVAATHLAAAEIPRKAPLVKYTGLWTDSPFTSKPVLEPGGPVVNPLDDYTLTGIAPVPGGYRITIMSKKNPDEKKVIEPGVASDFSVVSVNRNPGKSLGTTVVLKAGSIQGTVSFEPDLITLKAAPTTVPVTPGQPQANSNPPPGGNLPPGVNPPQAGRIQPNGEPNPQRQPRPRIVAPPAPSVIPPTKAATNGSNSNPDRVERSRRR